MAKWKKIITSGSNADLSAITGSTLALTNLPFSDDTTPLVINSSGTVSTGSKYALAAGGNTVGGSGLTPNTVIVGDGDSGIQIASSTISASFNSANVFGINEITSSKALFPTLSLGVIDSPITMSNVPSTSTGTQILIIDSEGTIKQRPSTEIGGVTGIHGGTNISTTSETGGITASLDDNISLTSISASGHITASSVKITNGISIGGNIDGNGDMTLAGSLTFDGVQFSETTIGTISGSVIFGSGSQKPSDILHQFTGSVEITGSNLTLVDGILNIPGFPDVANTLGGLALAENQVTNATFNEFSSSIKAHTASILLASASFATDILTNAAGILVNDSDILTLSNALADVSSSLASINEHTGSILEHSASMLEASAAFATAINNLEANTNNLDGNVTIGGNLTVLGNTTTFTTQDLIVEDRFIYLGSGSAEGDDVGIVFSSASAADNSGRMIFYDSSHQRFSTAKEFDSDLGDMSSIAKSKMTGDIATIRSLDLVGTSLKNTFGNGIENLQFGSGEVVIDKNNDIWIYTDSPSDAYDDPTPS